LTKVLVVNDGKRERELLLVERLVVGRDPACDISVEDGLLSRRHAEFVASAQAVTVRDLGSRNGIFVNGTRRAEQTLRQGDVVQIGPLRVRYLADRAAQAMTPERLNADGTVMIPVEATKAPPPLPIPSLDLDEELDGETRVTSAVPLADARIPGADAAVEDEATSFTPTPRPAPLAVALAAAKAQAAPKPAAAPVASPVPLPPPALQTTPAASGSDDRALASYVTMQLGSLAIIVFVSTIMPVIVTRGAVLRAVDNGNLAALLLWPFLPLVIAIAATVVVANLVNRRVLDAVKDSRTGAEGR